MTTLKRHRLALGLTLEALGKRLGVTAPAVHGWESGKTKPSPGMYPKLARVFQIPAFELTRFVSPEPTAQKSEAEQ